MDAGVRQSNDLTLEQFLGIRLGIEPASFQNHDLVASPKEFPCDRYASRSGANDADISRDGSPVIEFVEILNQLARDLCERLAEQRAVYTGRSIARTIDWHRRRGLISVPGERCAVARTIHPGNVGTLDSFRIKLR